MLAAILIAALGAAGPLEPLCGVRIHYENDAPLQRDRHYTSGLRIEASGCGPASPWDAAAGAVGRALGSDVSASGFVIGNNIYTPRTYASTGLDPADRPYAGWLYAGLMGSWWKGRHRFDLEADLGVTGRPSLAGDLQTEVHRLMGIPPFQYWHHQIPAALVVRLTAATELELLQLPGQGDGSTRPGQWRWLTFGFRGRVELGNLFDRASAGVVLRLGRIIDGSAITEPNPSFKRVNGRRELFWELFGYGRSTFTGVALNGLITGVPFTPRRSVTEARPLVMDTDLGVALAVGPLALGLGWTYRSTEIPTPWRWDEHGFFQVQLLYVPQRVFTPG